MMVYLAFMRGIEEEKWRVYQMICPKWAVGLGVIHQKSKVS